MSIATPEAELQPSESFPAGLTFTAYAAYGAGREPGGADVRAGARAELIAALVESPVDGLAVRGAYDTGGYRAESDLMLWLAAPSADTLQSQLVALRRPFRALGLEPFWTAIGVHREAEFSKTHVPAFFAGEPARRYACVYPFVRTHEWYLLQPERRRDLLIEHGRMGAGFPDVRANTTSAFGLGDYEWLLAFEADDLGRIVDLIRHLRGAEARLYTKNELPFITGLRKPLAEILDALP